MKHPDKAPAYVGLLGDVVGSRHVADRVALQERILTALREANRRVEAVQPLTPTIGDEFQGLYSDLGGAVRASLLVRLHLHPRDDVRFGIGWGALSLEDPERAPFGQDGPAWWAARDAIGRVAAGMGGRERSRGWRTAFVADPSSNPDPDLERFINAFLLCRDELVGRMDERDVQLMVAAIDGRSQEEAARDAGISQPAVSQRNQRSGAYAILQADALLGRIAS